jgi:hypothetical protein
MMDAKTFFRAIRLERREIRILNEKIYAREMDLLPSGIRYDKDQIQTSIEDTMTAKMAELGDYEVKRKELLRTLTTRQAQAIEIVSHIPDTKQRQVMEIYYFDTSNPTWDDVADEMGYDRRYILKVHGCALGWINDHISIK